VGVEPTVADFQLFQATQFSRLYKRRYTVFYTELCFGQKRDGMAWDSLPAPLKAAMAAIVDATMATLPKSDYSEETTSERA